MTVDRALFLLFLVVWIVVGLVRLHLDTSWF